MSYHFDCILWVGKSVCHQETLSHKQNTGVQKRHSSPLRSTCCVPGYDSVNLNILVISQNTGVRVGENVHILFPVTVMLQLNVLVFFELLRSHFCFFPCDSHVFLKTNMSGFEVDTLSLVLFGFGLFSGDCSFCFSVFGLLSVGGSF